MQKATSPAEVTRRGRSEKVSPLCRAAPEKEGERRRNRLIRYPHLPKDLTDREKAVCRRQRPVVCYDERRLETKTEDTQVLLRKESDSKISCAVSGSFRLLFLRLLEVVWSKVCSQPKWPYCSSQQACLSLLEG